MLSATSSLQAWIKVRFSALIWCHREWWTSAKLLFATLKPGLNARKTWDLRASHHFHQLLRNGCLSINFSSSTFALSYMFLVEDFNTVLHRNLYSSLTSSPISLLAFLSTENPQWRSQLTALWTSSGPRLSCSDAQNPPPSSKTYKCGLKTYSLFPVYCFNAELRKLQKSPTFSLLSDRHSIVAILVISLRFVS